MSDTHGSPEIKPADKPVKPQPAKAAAANKPSSLSKAERAAAMLDQRRKRERERGH